MIEALDSVTTSTHTHTTTTTHESKHACMHAGTEEFTEEAIKMA